MSFVVIPTERLELVLQTPEETLAFVEAMPPEDRAEISPDWIARVKQTKAGDPWSLGYTVIERESKASVGGCAFKGPPVDGMVEIAYGIDEPHRCKGYATEAANGLTEFAPHPGPGPRGPRPLQARQRAVGSRPGEVRV